MGFTSMCCAAMSSPGVGCAAATVSSGIGHAAGTTNGSDAGFAVWRGVGSLRRMIRRWGSMLPESARAPHLQVYMFDDWGVCNCRGGNGPLRAAANTGALALRDSLVSERGTAGNPCGGVILRSEFSPTGPMGLCVVVGALLAK